MGRLPSVHLFPQMRNAVNIKTIISPTMDSVKSQLRRGQVAVGVESVHVWGTIQALGHNAASN